MSYITDKKEEAGILSFTLTGVDTIIANCLRRVILSDIDILGIRSIPYEDNDITILKNTSQMNNEILSHRISCIPIYISDLSIQYESLKIICDVENKTENIIDITTKDFKIYDTRSESYLSEEDKEEIFPAESKTKDYILFARLLPNPNITSQNEAIHFEAKLSRVNASENSTFNVVSTCSYQFTPDKIKQKSAWSDINKEMVNNGKTSEEINDYQKNWELQDAKRIFKKNSFDFVIETIGIYTNRDIVKKGCMYIIQRLEKLKDIVDEKQMKIKRGNTNIETFDIVVENDNHTISKLIEYALYTLYFEENSILSFVGYRKEHPHRDYGIIRIAFNNDPESEEYIYNLLQQSIMFIVKIYTKILGDI